MIHKKYRGLGESETGTWTHVIASESESGRHHKSDRWHLLPTEDVRSAKGWGEERYIYDHMMRLLCSFFSPRLRLPWDLFIFLTLVAIYWLFKGTQRASGKFSFWVKSVLDHPFLRSLLVVLTDTAVVLAWWIAMRIVGLRAFISLSLINLENWWEARVAEIAFRAYQSAEGRIYSSRVNASAGGPLLVAKSVQMSSRTWESESAWENLLVGSRRWPWRSGSLVPLNGVEAVKWAPTSSDMLSSLQLRTLGALSPTTSRYTSPLKVVRCFNMVALDLQILSVWDDKGSRWHPREVTHSR